MNDAIVGIDWGTSQVRVALLDVEGNIIQERKGTSGVGVLKPHEFGKLFEELTQDWEPCPTLAAGMIGSRQGWREVEYLKCPVKIDGLVEKIEFIEKDKWKIGIVPGIKLHDKNKCDVMRGEETQIAGLIAQEGDNLNADVIMPGTHCKWVKIREGQIVEFQTYMTGELFNILCNHSILKHSIKDKDEINENIEEYINEMVDSKQNWQNKLFSLRARQLLENVGGGKLKSELSASLILSEIQNAVKLGYAKEKNIFLVGGYNLIQSYSIVLDKLDIKHKTIKGKELVYPALANMARKIGLGK